ncbi:glycoside hydrolase family 95 protein [Neptunitalea lumnitzerae]|uniref:Alpha-L-fucosidase 2 n=1 Tax=Neptunitalea lumnitzerae TaxID=2965509 RepID=A0ABQ5MKN1_9FLAO|nr:glycoside hydrolase family 95 protein [Neptunitalea sp. Y10]GLB49610.1 hypothetical protein Y10_19780 [Neptunitalea sp. Y10]
MNKQLIYLQTALLFFITILGSAQSSTDLKLWYNKPASNWYEALPLGNGRLGAMVFGNPQMERLQLNEETIWAGSPNSNAHDKALKVLPTVRQLIFDGKYKEAQDLATSDIMSQTNNGMPYQTFGSVYISFPEHANYTNYYRELNIADATSKVTYSVDGVKYTREVLTAFEDNVIVVKLSADQNAKITCNVLMNSPFDKTDAYSENDNIVLKGVTSTYEGQKGRVVFQGRTKAVNQGGKVSSSNGILSIIGADEVTLYISIATNFKNYKTLEDKVEAENKCKDYLTKASKNNFEAIKKAHVAYYQKFFNRVSFNLGITEAANKPTDERVANFSSEFDPQLAALYFQFGRYLLLSSSQPGGQPANLQGIWNDMLQPPWESKYTTNINAEMNYWPADVTNLTEMHEPFIQLIKEVSETGTETARKMYDANGWVLHHNTDIWRITGPIDYATSGMWPSGGAWLCQDAWERYLFTGDKVYLEEMYPVMKGAAEFFLDFMIEDPNTGWMVVVPSSSPEHSHYGKTGKAAIASGATMDNQLVFDLYSNVIKATEILNKDQDFANKLKQAREKIGPMKIGQYGQLQEWAEDWDDPEDKHRHVSHLYGIYPSHQISPFKTPELFQSVKKTLEHRGDPSTGWSMGWKVCLWARLLDGNHAYKLLNNQLSLVSEKKKGGGTYSNLFDSHPPFQIDGNFGCTAGIAEMLLQSHDGAIHVLPALPDVWKDGKITGLVARGGFIIDIEWKNNKLISLSVQSKLGGKCRVRLLEQLIATNGAKLKKAKGENSNMFYFNAPVKQAVISEKATIEKLKLPKYKEYDFNTEAGKTYMFKTK